MASIKRTKRSAAIRKSRRSVKQSPSANTVDQVRTQRARGTPRIRRLETECKWLHAWLRELRNA